MHLCLSAPSCSSESFLCVPGFAPSPATSPVSTASNPTISCVCVFQPRSLGTFCALTKGVRMCWVTF